MNKIIIFLLTILFAISVMGCATTQDWGTQDSDQSYYGQRAYHDTSNP